MLEFISSEDCIYDWPAMHLIAGMISTQAAIPPFVDFTFQKHSAKTGILDFAPYVLISRGNTGAKTPFASYVDA